MHTAPHHHEPSSTPHRYRWLVVFSAALFFFYEFIQMHMFNAISGDLMREFKVSASQLGNLSAMYLYADVLFLLPAGIILDRYSTKKVMLVAILFCILGTGFFALATNFWFAAICHFFAGIGNAFCFLSCIRLASRWFPSKMMAMVVGSIVTFAMAGGMIAETPLTYLSEVISWRPALLLNAGLGFIILLIILVFVRDYPKGYEQQHERQIHQLATLGFWGSIRLAITNKQNWLVGIYTSFLNLPVMLLCALWGNMYLRQIHGLTSMQASTVVSMIFLGTIVGGPSLGAWSDKLGLRKLPMIVGGMLSLVTVFSLIYSHDLSYGSLIVLFFLLGLFTSVQVLGYPVITESNNRIVTSTATALGSILIMGGAAVFQLVFGYILDFNWQNTLLEGVRVYPNSAYFYAMLIFPVTMIIALVAAACLRETHCREMNTHHQTR